MVYAMIADRDHVILLSADALRADHLSYRGYHRETSPALDELAAESLAFANAYSASSHTREAVPALLTGEYPDVAVDSTYRLAAETVASTLAGDGFATGGFHSNPFVSRAYGFGAGFDAFDDDLHLGRHRLIVLAQRALDKLRNRHYARAEEINDRSLAWIDSLDDDRPFFLWNHYMDTHGPYEPPGGYARSYPDATLSSREAQSLYRRAVDRPDSITESERRALIDLYDAEIRYTDERIGEFLDALEERGILERALLIVTSDHGDAFGEHGYYGHPRHLHEELTHVPLLVRPPGGAGRTVERPVSTLDVVATIEEFVGVGSERPGVSLRGDVAVDRPVFSQARGEGEFDHLRRYVLREGDARCSCELDRRDGRITYADCCDRSHRETLRSHVRERLQDERHGRTDSDGPPGRDAVPDGEVDRRLSALGYKE
jgi:arylsulfatase